MTSASAVKSFNPVRSIGRVAMAAGILSFAMSAAFSDTASAAVTGNPAADSGWTSTGNSLDNGTYIRGSGNFGYDLYTTSFTLEAGSPLLGNGWSIGDTILGVGGVIQTNNGLSAGWGSAFTGDAVNEENLTTSVRIVTKFGTSDTSWGASSTKPIPGNGNGSTSGGHGGEGAILLGTNVGDIPEANAGTVIAFPTQQRYTNGGATSTNLSNVGRLSYQYDEGLLASWESFLNTTILAAALAPGAEIPQLGDRVNQTLQRSNNSTLFTDALTTVVPEPTALSLLGVGAIAVLRRRRQMA